MNRILLILLLPLSAIAQTTYPVLSTTTARTIVGGVTNLPHLNSNNVFTGTGRWTGAVTLTNSGNVFAGDGSQLTGVGGGTTTNSPLLNGTNVWAGTNTFQPEMLFPANKVYWRQLFATGAIFLSSVATNVNNGTLTNNGGSHVGTQIVSATLPALLGTNSVVDIEFLAGNTNANSSSCFGYLYIGSGTNFVYDFTAVSTSASRAASAVTFLGSWSATEQSIRNGLTTPDPTRYKFSFADTSAPWEIRVVLSTTTSHTNAWIQSLRITERVVVP